MHKFLIPLAACLIYAAAMHAQVPTVISVPSYPSANPSNAPDFLLPCNFAGTFTVGQFIGQSNDTALDTIFLCEGDSVFIDHNGDFDLSGDPVGATPPGIAWAFYDCTPTVMGDNYQNLITNEPCLVLGPTNTPVFAFGQPNGDIWFFNSGFLQDNFNSGQPVLFHFAPITVDNFDPTQTYENNIVGAPPGPCVNVNTSVEFEVVYLNAIAESGVSSNFVDDCVGKFRVSGGYPQWNTSARYTIDIFLKSDPTVKALIHNGADQIGNNADVIFSVSQPGTYVVTIEDGKSCGHSFEIVMGTCNPADNIVVALPDTVAPPGSQICIPITVQNFTVVGASFSVNWDPTVLQYLGTQNPNAQIGTFNASNLNTQETLQGHLGLIIYNQDVLGQVIDIPDGGSVLEVCFNVIAPLDSCSALNVANDPTLINIENQIGTTVAVTADNGQFCVDFLPLAIAVEVTDTTCTGTASIKVTATGGQQTYDVIIENLVGSPTYSGTILTPGTSFTRAGISSGSYEVCVTDANNTTICDTVTLDIAILGVSLQNTQQPSCFGLSDGTVTAIVTLNGVAVTNPGPPAFTFNWSPANPVPNSPVYNNAKAGQYAVTVTNTTSGCTQTASGTLGQPSQLIIPIANVTVTPATCTGVQDGKITLRPIGGTPFPGGEYQYNWEYVCGANAPLQGAFGQDSIIMIQDLPACNWQVTITDANGCTANQQYDVNNQKEVDVQLSGASPVLTNCFGDSSATICVKVIETPASANPNYLFFFTPVGFNQTTPSATENCYENVPAGDYFVVAIDGAGCGDTMSIKVTSPEALVISDTTLTKPNCTFQNNGAIELFVQGGTGGPNGYTYNWNPGGPGPKKLNNLFPGDYSVTVTDTKGCQDSISVTLTLPDPPAITGETITPVKCGSDGSICVTAPTAVLYNWATIGGQNVGNSSCISGLSGDTFLLTITDAQGCMTMDTFILDPVIPMSFSDTTLTQPSCFGASDGLISIGVMDGNLPYQSYTWSVDSTGFNTSTLLNIPAGNYTITVVDAQGCTLTGTFDLGQPPQILVTHTTPQPVSCFGVCDGAVTITANYADNSAGTFVYVWSDGGTGNTRNNLCADTINVLAIDANNCFGTDTFIVPGPPEITATITTTPATCNGGDDGQAIATGAGGNGPAYSYKWSSGAMTSVASGLAAGDWDVTVSDKNGCTAEFTAKVTQPAPIVVTKNDAASSDVKCSGGDDGKLGVDVVGGNPGTYTFSWANQDSVVVGNMQNESMLPAGTYSVTVTDVEGCTGVLQNLALNEPPPVQGSYEPFEDLLCFGDETTLYVDTIFGGSGGPYKFSVDFGVVLSPGFPVSLNGGEHYITYYDRFDCELTDTINVVEPDPILVTFNPPTYEIELGDTTYQLNPLITGAVVDTFIWFPGESLRSPKDLTPFVHTYTSETYTLTVYDANGCEGSGSITITVDPNRNVYIPNIFKAGSTSGLNDHFNPMVGLGVEKVNYMRVYDRWGTLMYERNDFYPNNDNLAEGWDGRYRGDYVNPAVFVYVIEVVFLDGKVLLYRGDVTVYR